MVARESMVGVVRSSKSRWMRWSERCSILACWLGIAIFFGTSMGVGSVGTERVLAADCPNIMVILADDLGYSDLGCYGGEVSTPNLDRLAENGLRFTQFYNTARCWPSRAALLTGYYPQQVRRDTIAGVLSGSQGTRPGWAPLISEIVRAAGYRTYHSGKWHVDGEPLANGFDRSYNLSDQNRYFSPQHHQEDGQPLPSVSPDQGYYATTAIADHAIRCLRDHQQSYAQLPFFHYVCFTAPHFPLQAPESDIDRYRGVYECGWDRVQELRGQRLLELGIVRHRVPQMERDLGPPYHYADVLEKTGAGEVNRPVAWEDLTEIQRAFQSFKMAIHAAMVSRMDQEVGRIIKYLEQAQVLDNTLLIFASDNGASAEMMIRGDGHDSMARPGSAKTHLCLGPGWSSVANSPFRRHKTWVHEGGIATPFVVHWPRGIVARGELRHEPAHLIDLWPTVLELTNARAPEIWQGAPVPERPGRSLATVFSHSGADRVLNREYLWWCHEDNRAIRKGDWKLVSSKQGPWELYDLGTDRGETNDLSSIAVDRVGDMERLWQQEFEHQRFWATR